MTYSSTKDEHKGKKNIIKYNLATRLSLRNKKIKYCCELLSAGEVKRMDVVRPQLSSAIIGKSFGSLGVLFEEKLAFNNSIISGWQKH